MSTLSKFPEVRKRRAERRDMRRGMHADLKVISDLIARGRKLPKTEANVQVMTTLGVRRTVMNLMIRHIEQICRDPKRSGECKDLILAKLNDAPPAPATSLALAPGESASTPLVGV